MARQTVRELLVKITGKDAELERAINRSIRNLDAVGRRAERIGRDLTLKFTAPLVAAGAVATKLASDFDSEMTKIVTLVGVAEDQVNDWRRALLEMGPAVGKGPQELARALFVVTSAGQRGAEALQIVERAAKASAAGLGDTAEIARTVTAAMQAYGSENLSAERATDILVATVREGNLEASALAGSLGRVLGIAAQVGVTFDQVGGFIATFTRLGVGAEEAVVALRGVLGTLLKPTQGAQDALNAMGMSVNDLRVSIVERGLAQTLVDLVQRSRAAGVEIADIIPNIRALAGVLGTAAAQGDDFLQIADNIADSTGILDDAFARVEQTTAFTFAQLRANLQALAIAMGDALAPTVNELLRSLLPLLRTLQGVDAELVRNAARVLALTAAVGPLIFVVGSAARTAATLANSLLLARAAGIALGGILGPAGAVVVGLGLLVAWFTRTQMEAVRASLAVAQLRGEIFALSQAERTERGIQFALDLDQTLLDLDEAREKLESLQEQTRSGVVDAGLGATGRASDRIPQVREAAEAVRELEQREAELRQALGFVNEAQRRSAESAKLLEEEQAKSAETARKMMEEMLAAGLATEESGKKVRTASEILEELEQRLKLASDLEGLSGAFDATQLSVAALQSALQELLTIRLDPTDERVTRVAGQLDEFRARMEGVSRVMAELEEQMALAEFLGAVSSEFDVQAFKAAALESALRSLRKFGLEPMDPEVVALADELRDLRGEMADSAAQAEELGSAVSLAHALIASARSPVEEYQDTMVRLQLALDAGRISQEEFSVAAGEATRVLEESEKQAARTGQVWEDQFAGAVISATGRVSLNFKAMADDIIRQIARVTSRLLAMRALMAVLAPFAGGGGVLGAMFAASAAPFGGARAAGGPVHSGRSYIVGERGPEMFVPRSAGTIVPNKAMAGGGRGGPTAREILAALGPPPTVGPPEYLALSDFYRRLIGAALPDYHERGGRHDR